MISYVPTVLASTLVLFLGIELTLEAVWESAKTLQFTEWLVVMTTLIACTILGYAIGFGVGIGAATVVYLFWGVRDTVGLSDALYMMRESLTKISERSSGRSGSGKWFATVSNSLPSLTWVQKPSTGQESQHYLGISYSCSWVQGPCRSAMPIWGCPEPTRNKRAQSFRIHL